MDDEMDTTWSPAARTALQQATAEAVAALQEHARLLADCAGEQDFDVEEAFARAAALRRTLSAWDDAAFDLSGSFPICLPDPDEELGSDGGLGPDGALAADGSDDEPAAAQGGLDEESGQPVVAVTLVVRADHELADPEALAGHARELRAATGEQVTDPGPEEDLQTVLDALLAQPLVEVPGLVERRKAIFPIPMEELEDDEEFAQDPLGILG